MAIDIGDIIADLRDPTVQKLLGSTDASPFLVGLDTRPADGPIFSIQRAGARQLLVGAPCNGAAGCIDIPAPIAKLVKDLTAFDQQQLASPRCAAITTGAFACGATKCSNLANLGCFDDLGSKLLGSFTRGALSVLCAAP